MASGNINCPIPIGNTLFVVECLHSPKIPLMINSDLDDNSSNNNQLENHKETSATLIPYSNENSRPIFPQSTNLECYNSSNSTASDESMSNLPLNPSTMLHDISPSVSLSNPNPPDPHKQNNHVNKPASEVNDNSNKIQAFDISDKRPIESVQLSIPLVPCFPQINIPNELPSVKSKPVSPKVALQVPPRPANKASPPNIPLVFDITPEETRNIPELLVDPTPSDRNCYQKPGYRIALTKDVISESISGNNAAQPLSTSSQNPPLKPYYNVPPRMLFNASIESTAASSSSVAEPSSSSHSSEPDFSHPLRLPLAFNEAGDASLSNQSPVVPRPDFQVPLVLCTSESNTGHAVTMRGGLMPGMLGGSIPEELSISVDFSGEEGGHSWRPGHANALCEDFFLPPAPQLFSGAINSVPNSSESHRDMQSYVDSQKAELNIIRYEVINARRRINETRSAVATLSGHLKEVLKFQNIAEMEKLTNENAQLRLECQCLCMEVDYYLKGQAPLGEVDEKFYKDSNEKAESSTCVDGKSSEEEGDQWECHKCTFVNHPAIRCCEMCHVPRRTKRRNSSTPHSQYAADESCYCHPQKR